MVGKHCVGQVTNSWFIRAGLLKMTGNWSDESVETEQKTVRLLTVKKKKKRELKVPSQRTAKLVIVLYGFITLIL